MKWTRLVIASVGVVLLLAVLFADPAEADTQAYACEYPGVGTGVVVLGVSGEFCDFPTEINGSHYHCEFGQFNPGAIFGIGLQGGTFVGSLGSGAIGGGTGCSWRCPDGTLAPAPNPPGAWKDYLIPTLNFCKDHTAPAGPTSELVATDEGGNGLGAPNPDMPAGVPVPVPAGGQLAPVTNPGTPNPEATENQH